MNNVVIGNTKEQCLRHLRETFDGLWKVGEPKAAAKDSSFDFVVALGYENPELLLVELKEVGRITKAQIQHFLVQAALAGKTRKTGHPMLWAPWIPDEMGDILRQANAFYLDALGNVYLRLPKQGLLLDARGKVPEKKLYADRGRLVEPTGLMVLHHLLTHRQAVNDPYRTIAAQAGVALGTVAIVMRELEETGYIAATGKKLRQLQRVAELVDLFVKGYALKLRPTCFMGTFQHENKVPRQLYDHFINMLEPTGIKVAATGVLAAEELTGYLRADTITLFIGEEAAPIMGRERMLRNPEGNLTLLRYFGETVHDPDDQARRFATPLLVYAELLQVGRPRETEAAAMIFDRYLKELVHEP